MPAYRQTKHILILTTYLLTVTIIFIVIVIHVTASTYLPSLSSLSSFTSQHHTYHPYLPTYLTTYQPTYLPSHTYLPTYLSTYLPTYLPKFGVGHEQFAAKHIYGNVLDVDMRCCCVVVLLLVLLLLPRCCLCCCCCCCCDVDMRITVYAVCEILDRPRACNKLAPLARFSAGETSLLAQQRPLRLKAQTAGA